MPRSSESRLVKFGFKKSSGPQIFTYLLLVVMDTNDNNVVFINIMYEIRPCYLGYIYVACVNVSVTGRL